MNTPQICSLINTMQSCDNITVMSHECHSVSNHWQHGHLLNRRKHQLLAIVMGINLWPKDSHKKTVMWVLMFILLQTWASCCTNSWVAGDLRCYGAHVMSQQAWLWPQWRVKHIPPHKSTAYQQDRKPLNRTLYIEESGSPSSVILYSKQQVISCRDKYITG